MRVALKAELSPPQPTAEEQPGRGRDDREGNDLLPIHHRKGIRTPRRSNRISVAARRVARNSRGVSELVYLHTHRVSYAECTVGNHIYYSRYLDLLETARGEFFRHLGVTFQQLHEAGTVFPVVEAHVRYRGAARYDDVLRIELWMNEVSRVRLNFGARILNQNNQLLIEANTLHACTGIDDKLKRVPEELTARLQPYLRPVATKEAQ